MATEKWVAGAVASYTAASTTAINIASTGLVSGNAVISEIDLDNSTALDMFADLSIKLASITPTGNPFVGVYLYPLNEDGTTYGDGRFGSSTAAVPPQLYFVDNIPLVASAGVQVGSILKFEIPPGHWKVVFYNGAGVAWAVSGNEAKYRTYNRQVA